MTDVLMVASEAAPFYTTGGLAEVMGSLPAALVEQGHEVDVVVPLYENGRPDKIDRIDEFQLSVGPSQYRISVWSLCSHGVRYLFLGVPGLFDRSGMYGDTNSEYADNGIRFGVFCRAAVEIVLRRTSQPQVIHCHDWQTGLVPVMLKSCAPQEPSVAGVKTVFTVHNLAYQGRCDKFVLPSLGLDWSLFNPDHLEFWGDVSFMKGGLVFGDLVTTVSPSYARDILTPASGCGLDGVLRAREANLVGVLSGIDYHTWDPNRDPHIARAYSFADLSGKATCKESLLQSFWFADDPLIPTIGVVTRFTEQTGVDLLRHVAGVLLMENARLIVHGRGDPPLEAELTQLAQAYPQNVSVVLGFDDRLAHRIYAGADMFLIPGRSEPCGFGPLQSLRYGAVPIVAETSGASDSVTEETGFMFHDCTAQALCDSVREACTAYRDRPYHWRRMTIRGMQQDFSWARCAREYSELYATLAEPRSFAP